MYLNPDRHYRLLACYDCGAQADCSNVPYSLSALWVVEGQDTSPEEYDWIIFVCAACAAFYQQSPLCHVAPLSSYTPADLARLDELAFPLTITGHTNQELLDGLSDLQGRRALVIQFIRSIRCPQFAPQPSPRPASPRRPIPLSLRYTILQRDGFRCKTCGRTPEQHGVVLHVDHIVAVVKGGTNDPGNLRALCAECNLGKSDR